MKHFKALLLILSSVLIFSCKKDVQSPNIDLKLISEIQNMKSEKDIKLAYGLTNPDERLSIWKNHLAKFVDDSKLTSKQNEHLKKLLLKLSPESFGNKNQAFQVFAIRWINDAAKIFTKKQYDPIFASLSTPNLDEFEMDNVDAGAKYCQCKSINSVFTTCGGIWGDSTCSDFNCKFQSEFCGFLFLERCDARCVTELAG